MDLIFRYVCLPAEETLLPPISGHMDYSFCNITSEGLNGVSWKLVKCCATGVLYEPLHFRCSLRFSAGEEHLAGKFCPSVCLSLLSAEIVLPFASCLKNNTFCHAITQGRLLMKFGLDIMPLKPGPKSYSLLSYSGKNPREVCSNLWAGKMILCDEVTAHDPP
jgi:hypothetical protein